jgi:hypothetical protein
MRLCFESKHDPAPREAPGGAPALLAFISFAAMRGFGATHPLALLADRLHDAHRLTLGPLTTFYDARVDDEDDAVRRELSWQPAGPLVAALNDLAATLTEDPQCAALAERGGAPLLGTEARALATALDALGPAAVVRLGYEL